MTSRLALALVALALAGCEREGGRDAGRPEMDAEARDGGSTELDGAPIVDGSGDALALDASWGSCAVAGTAGTCMDVSLCSGDRMPVAGLCPGPAEIQCCIPRIDAGPMPDAGPAPDAGACDPSVMPQPNLGLVESPGEGGCPAGMVPVTDSFCVDRHEASLEEILADGTTTEWSPYFHPGTRRVRALSRAGAVPQAYIDGVRAAAACEEAGKRLCTDAEWLRACQGSAGTTYPYGETRMTGTCNDHRDRHPAIERFGTSEDWIWSRLGDPCIDQLPMSLARTGEHAGCAAECGALDMMGNLHEWTADPAGTFRGGFYVDTVINGPGCLYRTTAHDRGHWDYSTGFRCCADR